MADSTSNVRSSATASTSPERINWLSREWSYVRAAGVGYLVAGVVFAVVGVVLTTDPVNGGGVVAAIASLAISVPVLFAKRAPAGAAGAQAAGYLLNDLLFGPMIRCGFVLPGMLVIVFALGCADSKGADSAGAHSAGVDSAGHRNSRWLGLGACAATSVMMSVWDPALDSSAPIFIAGLASGFFLAGALIRSRTNLVNTLQRRTGELEQQRDRTAALEVAADRARVGADLERLIRAQIAAIGVSAALAQSAADDDLARSRAALVDVENCGRATLAQMREVVGDLRDVPTQPSPGLDQLAELLRRATTSNARLAVHGGDRPLTRSMELSAYRIVEQLLKTLRDHPTARVEVEIRVTDDALEIRVCGPTITDDIAGGSPGTDSFSTDSVAAVTFDQERAMNAVRARAELHGGRLLTRVESPGKTLGRKEFEVRLPLATTSAR